MTTTTEEGNWDRGTWASYVCTIHRWALGPSLVQGLSSSFGTQRVMLSRLSTLSCLLEQSADLGTGRDAWPQWGGICPQAQLGWGLTCLPSNVWSRYECPSSLFDAPSLSMAQFHSVHPI